MAESKDWEATMVSDRIRKRNIRSVLWKGERQTHIIERFRNGKLERRSFLYWMV